jgi:hypothetical protein
MSLLQGRRMVLLVCALMVAGTAGAAGRDTGSRPSSGKKSSSSEAAKSDDWRQGLQTWLGRLEGKFSIKLFVAERTVCNALGPDKNGPQRCTTTKPVTYVSAVDCRGVGEGGGLLCTFDELRYEATGSGAEAVGATTSLLSNDLPGRVLLGIDPATRKLTAMIMEANGAGYSAKGALAGNEVTFKDRCILNSISTVTSSCTWSFWIQANPDGRRIRMTRSSSFGGSSEFRTLSGVGEPHTFELTRVE